VGNYTDPTLGFVQGRRHASRRNPCASKDLLHGAREKGVRAHNLDRNRQLHSPTVLCTGWGELRMFVVPGPINLAARRNITLISCYCNRFFLIWRLFLSAKFDSFPRHFPRHGSSLFFAVLRMVGKTGKFAPRIFRKVRCVSNSIGLFLARCER